MRFFKTIISTIASKSYDKKTLLALSIFFLFLIAHTLRLAFFNNLMFDPDATLITSVQHSGMFVKFSIICILSVLLILWKQPLLFIGFYLVQTLYMFINSLYHFYFEGYLHVNQYLGMATEALDLFKHKALPSGPFLWFLFLDVPFFIGCLVFYRYNSRFVRSFVLKKPLIVFACLLLCLAIIWDPLNREQSVISIMNDAYSSDSHVIKKYGLFAFNVMDLLHYKDAQSRVQRINYGQRISFSGADTAHPNFIFIQLESVDSNIINYRYKNKPVTPFLNSLSKQCVFYPFTLSFHKAGSTSDCEFSIINSVEPFDDYPSIKLRNYNYPNSMLKLLAAAGYDAVAFHGNRGTYFNRHIALKKMGFKAFFDMMAMNLEEKAWGAPDGEVFKFVQDKLKVQKTPFCHYIITMSSHEPFNLIQSYFSTHAYDDVHDELLKRFLTAMTYVDGELGKFVDFVQKNAPNTFIIIYGDHTPAIQKSVYRKASFLNDYGLFEFVPCYIISPQGTRYTETRKIASFLDIAPTILKAANVSCDYKSNGIDLLAQGMDSATIAFNNKTFSRTKLFSQIKTNR
jgi:lipoteichoic acid synthase